QTRLSGQKANVWLEVLAHRQQHPRQNSAIDTCQGVGLVFAWIDTSQEGGLAITVDDLGIMPSGYKFCIDAIGVVEQSPELDPVIALHTGVWRTAMCVGIYKVVDDA